MSQGRSQLDWAATVFASDDHQFLYFVGRGILNDGLDLIARWTSV